MMVCFTFGAKLFFGGDDLQMDAPNLKDTHRMTHPEMVEAAQTGRATTNEASIL